VLRFVVSCGSLRL